MVVLQVQTQVPREQCRQETRRQCATVPRQECRTEPRQQCRSSSSHSYYHKYTMFGDGDFTLKEFISLSVALYLLTCSP